MVARHTRPFSRRHARAPNEQQTESIFQTNKSTETGDLLGNAGKPAHFFCRLRAHTLWLFRSEDRKE